MESYGLLQRILEDTMKQQLAIKRNKKTSPTEQVKLQTCQKQTAKKVKKQTTYRQHKAK